MKKFLKIAGVGIVVMFILQVLINLDFISIGKNKLGYEELGQIIGNENGADTRVFDEEPDLPGQEYEDINLKKGDEYINQGLSSLAVNEYIESIKKNQDNPEAFTKIGKIHFENGEIEKARENFVKAIQLNPNYLEARIYLGRSYLRENNFDKAKEIFQNITARNQLSTYYKGLIASFYGDHETAKNLLAEAIAIGTNEEISEKAKEVLKSYQEFAKNQGGQDIHLKTLLARAYNQVGEYNMAMPILFEVLKGQKDYRDAWIILGYSYLNTDKIEDALRAFETALSLDSQKPETLYFLGITYFAKDDLAKATSYIEQAIDNGFEPKVQANQKLAEIYLLKQDFQQAANKYEEILEANDSDINLYIRPVWLYIDKIKNPAKAVEIASRAVSVHPEKAMSHNLLGWAYVASNDLEKGKQYLTKAIEIDPNLSAAYLNMGWMYEKKGLLNLAGQNYEKAMELGADTSVGNLAREKYEKIKEQENILTETFKADISSDTDTTGTTDTESKVGTRFLLPRIIKK